MQRTTPRTIKHFTDGKAVDQHQDDDRRQRHPQHADAEDNLRNALAGQRLQGTSQVEVVTLGEHGRQLAIGQRQSLARGGDCVVIHFCGRITCLMFHQGIRLAGKRTRHCRLHRAILIQDVSVLSVKGRSRSNHHAGRGENKGNDETDREIEYRQATMGLAPFLAQHRVRQQEGHVDTHGGAERSHDDVALILGNFIRPEFRILSRGLNCRPERGRRFEEAGWPRNETGEDGPPVETAVRRQGNDHAEERDHHDANEDFQNDLEQLDPLVATLVEEIDHRRDRKQDQ